MRRKLINHEVFNKIDSGSITKTEQELIKSEDILAKALNKPGLKLHSFNESTATFESLDKTYVHAGYRMSGESVLFENIEELVIDETSARNASKEILRKMIDNLMEDKTREADDCFKEYISLPSIRRDLSESTVGKSVKKISKKCISENVTHAPKSAVRIKFNKVPARKLKEWKVLSENVNDYVSYQEFGPTMNHTEVRRDTSGNVVNLKIPNSRLRNEGKILSFNWKTLNSDVQILRGKMKGITEDTNFCRAMADLRRANALSDSAATQEVIEAVVAAWPNLIYLTKDELAKRISEALAIAGELNYDDEACAFFAEGILRTAAGVYGDRINKIMRLSGVELKEKSEDVYENFQQVVGMFYPALDNSSQLEMQVFADLYNALVEIHKIAGIEGNANLKSETNEYLKELYMVLNQEAKPTLELAGEVSAWLTNLLETNLETKPWDVSNSVHISINGDNPKMAQLAKVSYTPSSDFSGDWGDPAPVSDGKSYKGPLADQMRNNAWGNIANNDIYPDLKNPYVPKGADYLMQKGNDSAATGGDSDWSRYQSNDTWPALQNPYTPKEAGGPGGTGYKMKSDDLVVDQ